MEACGESIAAAVGGGESRGGRGDCIGEGVGAGVESRDEGVRGRKNESKDFCL